MTVGVMFAGSRPSNGSEAAALKPIVSMVPSKAALSMVTEMMSENSGRVQRR